MRTFSRLLSAFFQSYFPKKICENADVIEEEAAIQRRREEKAEVYGTKSGDVEGLLFPDIKLEGEDQENSDNSEKSSWFW